MNTKTDPWQLPVGQFQSLQNSIFQKGGLLQKRNGYGELTLLSDSNAHLTTLNNNLLSIGNTVSAYSSSLDDWITKGTLQPCALNVLPLIRNNLNQTQDDTAIANGLVLTTYTETSGVVVTHLYAVADVVTGQNIVEPSPIPFLVGGAISGSSRAFVVGKYFVIVSPVLVGASTFLQYVSLPTANPVSGSNVPNVSPAQNVFASTYAPISSNPGWDGVVTDNTLVVAYNTTSGGQGVLVTSLLQSQIAANSQSTVSHVFAGATNIAGILSICVDITPNPDIIYISFWNPSNQNGYTCAVFIGFGSITTQFAPQQTITGLTILNLASAAQNGSCLLFSEVSNNYSYDSAIPTHYISAVTVSSAGVVGTPYVAIRSVGLASKAFIKNGVIYFLSAFQSPFQPSYFLMNGSLTTAQVPVVVAKLAYQNGGGYVTLGLPSVTVGDTCQVSYLFKDSVEALNTLNDTQQTAAGGIYSQTGINLVSFDIGTKVIDSSEIAGSLHISGGYLSMFDGYLPVEQNFFLFPDSVECTWSATGGNIEAVPSGGTTGGKNYFYQVTYEWTDNTGLPSRSAPSIPVGINTSGTGTTGAITVRGPMLRLTAKVANKVKIVIYRWSVHTQAYNQVTSITVPLLNDTTVDSFTFVDTLPDANVVGNNLLYTTGGVVPNTNGPASNIMTLFDTRLLMVSAEDPNTLWISKTVVAGAPVEMTSAFTIYVAPNIGTTGSSGPMTAAAPMDDKLIVFKKNSIFFMNGTGPDNLGSTAVGSPLGNYSQPTFITAVVGCTNQDSIVLTVDGLMFQSDKGIWLLGRDLQTKYIGSPVEKFNSSTVTSAEVIPGTNYVVFSLNTGGMLMYDYFAGQWGTFVGFTVVSSCIYNGLHTVLTNFSKIWQETPGQYLDGTNPVLMQFTTSWFNLASLQGYERFREFYILAKYLSPHTLIAGVAYNYNDSILHQSTIKPLNFSPSVPSPFGVPTPLGSSGPLEQWRIHAKQQLCQSFQLSITEVFNPDFGTIAGAGFTMSGINCEVEVKKSTRPIKAANTVG